MSEAFKTFDGSIQIVKVEINNSFLSVHLSDERIISVPVKKFSKIQKALQDNQPDMVNNFEISPSGYGISWPDLDEDISIKAFL